MPAKPTASRDRLTKEQRSWNMSRIRCKDTKPELLVRRLLTALGLRYRLHRAGLPGKPDIVLGPRRLVIFVHGCFWHRHAGCKVATMPAANRNFWQTKLEGNAARDRRHRIALQKLGWRVVTVWECETRQPARLARRLALLLAPGTEH